MTPAEVAFALQTQELTLGAAGACLIAAFAAGTVAIVHATSSRRPRGAGFVTISVLTVATLFLFSLAFKFWSLP